MSPKYPSSTNADRRTLRQGISTWIARRELHASSARHLRNCRQLAVFAFDHIGHAINLDGIYERAYLDAYFAWTRQAGVEFSAATVLDVGANIGNHGLYFSDHFASVHCFEPNPRTFGLLALNAELAVNMKTHNVGLSDAERVETISFDPSNMGGASVARKKGESALPVRLLRMDDVVDGINNILMIKLDVEGHELSALQGGRETLRRHQPLIMFEQHPPDFEAGTSRVLEFLRTCGYQEFAVIRRSISLGAIGRLRARVRGAPLVVERFGDLAAGSYHCVIAIPAWFGKGVSK